MKKSPLPAEFVAWLKSYILSQQFTTVIRLHRGLILRWGFWLDGIGNNALPGYETCPKPLHSTGLPAGWSYAEFHAIAKETIGTERVYQARKQAAAAPLHHDCGSGQDYGICKACGKGHGHILYQDATPTTLVTSAA